MGKIFNPANDYLIAKTFLEGNGLVVENKQGHPVDRWTDTIVLLTANKLPKPFYEPKRYKGEDDWDFQARYDTHMALKSRCGVHYMPKGHSRNEKFPYTADDLARYMDYILDLCYGQ